MPLLIKTGLFAFGGVRVVDVQTTDGLSAADVAQLEAAGWVSDDAPAPATDSPPDFAFAEGLDKDDLAEYAASFGVKLDKRKPLSTMLEAFKGAV